MCLLGMLLLILKGLYRYKHLPYGVASAPAIFQKFMETVLNGIPNIVCYLDDILVTGKYDAKHLHNLREVLTHYFTGVYGLRIKPSKCNFLEHSVEYLGHVVDSEGLHVTPSKVQAVIDAPVPQDLTQLRALLNYYSILTIIIASIIINYLSGMLHLLNNLLRKDQPWEWTAACNTAFIKLWHLHQYWYIMTPICQFGYLQMHHQHME